MILTTAIEEWWNAITTSFQNDFLPQFRSELRWTAIAAGIILLLALVIWIVRLVRSIKAEKASSGQHKEDK